MGYQRKKLTLSERRERNSMLEFKTACVKEQFCAIDEVNWSESACTLRTQTIMTQVYDARSGD